MSYVKCTLYIVFVQEKCIGFADVHSVWPQNRFELWQLSRVGKIFWKMFWKKYFSCSFQIFLFDIFRNRITRKNISKFHNLIIKSNIYITYIKISILATSRKWPSRDGLYKRLWSWPQRTWQTTASKWVRCNNWASKSSKANFSVWKTLSLCKAKKDYTRRRYLPI